MADGKGTAQWLPVARMGVTNVKAGYKPRFLRNDPDNIENKLAEGWIIPNKTNGLAGDFTEDKDKSSGGRRHKEMVLAVMPVETIAARSAYYEKRSDAQVKDIKNDLQRKLSASSPTAVAHGTIEGHPAAPVIQ